MVNVHSVHPSSPGYDIAGIAPSPVCVPFAGWQAVNQSIPMHGCSDGRSQSSLRVPYPIPWNCMNMNAIRAKRESVRIMKRVHRFFDCHCIERTGDYCNDVNGGKKNDMVPDGDAGVLWQHDYLGNLPLVLHVFRG
jgi:hypothetical protein